MRTPSHTLDRLFRSISVRGQVTDEDCRDAADLRDKVVARTKVQLEVHTPKHAQIRYMQGSARAGPSEKPVEPHEAVMADRRSQDDTKMTS